MKRLFKNLKQNKGMSLVEVIVSVAVSMIVLFIAATFMTTSTNFFNRQSGSIDLQDELLEASNNVNDALMSASSLMIVNNTSGGVDIYTGEYTSDKKSFITGKGSARRIEWLEDKKEMYVYNTPSLDSSEDKAGYLMANFVSDIRVRIQDECVIKMSDGSTRYLQPLILKVEVEVFDGSEKRSDSKMLTLRNTINTMVINGKTYKDNDGILIEEK